MSRDLGREVPDLEKLYARKLWADFSYPIIVINLKITNVTPNSLKRSFFPKISRAQDSKLGMFSWGIILVIIVCQRVQSPLRHIQFQWLVESEPVAFQGA